MNHVVTYIHTACACGVYIHSFQAVLQFLRNAVNEKEEEKEKKEGDNTGKEGIGS